MTELSIREDPNVLKYAWNLFRLFDPEEANIPEDFTDQARGVMLGLAVGNLLGLPVEGKSRATIQTRFSGGVREIDPKEVSRPMDDDLAQAVDLAQALASSFERDSDTDWVQDFVSKLIRWRHENGRGIGNTTSAVIDLLEQGIPPAEAARAVYEAASLIAPNGGVMRCAPVALLWHSKPIRLIEDSAVSCIVTHYSPYCQWSCILINAAIALLMGGIVPHPAMLSRAVRADEAPAEVVEWVEEISESIDSLRWNHRHIGHTLLCMQFGLWAAITPLGFEEALVQVIGAGGDTDTNGAVAGAVLGARYGASSIPQRWLDCIPQKERLEGLVDKLMAAAP